MNTPNEEPRTLREKLQRLHDLSKPTWDVPEGTAPFMHFGDAFIFDCEECDAMNTPCDLWDVSVALDPAETDSGPVLPGMGPAYGALYTVVVHDAEYDGPPKTPEEKRDRRRAARKEWHDAEDRACALLDVLTSLPEAIAAVDDLAEEQALREKLSRILRETANALHGEPMRDGLWSWHDLADLATRQHRAVQVGADMLTDDVVSRAEEGGVSCLRSLQGILRNALADLPDPLRGTRNLPSEETPDAT
jgi:hypothetical protein